MMASPESQSLSEVVKTLITANHIIHLKDVVDAYGHVSARHPTDPTIFIMSGSVAPATVSQPSDLIHYWVKDASPVNPNSGKGYSERFIHSEIYKRFSDVNSVIHSHSESVLPFCMGGVEMRPCFHIAGFLGANVPLFDIVDFYPESAQQDMLINTQDLGCALSGKFLSNPSSAKSQPDRNVVLMSNHGFTTVGKSIPQAVFRAVYTHVNAGLQAKTIMLHAAMGRSTGKDMKYLTEKQIVGCTAMGENTQQRPWGLWCKEVEANPLYVNKS